MEDNEFEEVTIISHTDLCSSVLPQATAERLMREIRLEVTQKISPTENVKLGSLQDPEAERRLNKIQEVMLSQHETEDLDLHMYHGSCMNPEHFWIVGSNTAYGVDITRVEQGVTDRYPRECHHVIEWGKFVLMFFHNAPVNVYNTETKTWSHLTHVSFVDLSEEPAAVGGRIYFKSQKQQLAFISIDSEGNITDGLCDKVKHVNFICPDRVTDSLVIMDISQAIHLGGTSRDLSKDLEFPFFTNCLKQMYSDHFLVSVGDQQEHPPWLYLIDCKTLRFGAGLKLETSEETSISFNVRMLAPRTAGSSVFHFVLALNGEEVICVCEYQQKLYHITSCCLSKMMYGLSHLHRHSWIAVGKRSEVNSLIVEFPKALRVC